MPTDIGAQAAVRSVQKNLWVHAYVKYNGLGMFPFRLGFFFNAQENGETVRGQRDPLLRPC